MSKSTNHQPQFDNQQHAHEVAAVTHGKQDHLTGHELSRLAAEHSQTHQEVATMAHGLWEARGCPAGSPDQDWFQAARNLHLR